MVSTGLRLGAGFACKEALNMGVGRLYLHGISRQEIVFLKDGEDVSKAPPVYVPVGRKWGGKDRRTQGDVPNSEK